MTSFASLADAERIGREMVEGGYAACVNMVPGVRSIFRFRGQLEEADETLALFKTADAERLMSAIGAAHPYDLPVIESWPVMLTSQGVAEWIDAETGRRA
ncbi:MAG: divalent-cation tolerance protein CutA [Thermaurantiacus sp.]